MVRLLTAAAVLALLSGPVLAQSSDGSANDQAINADRTDMVNPDAALPGGSQSGTKAATGENPAGVLPGSKNGNSSQQGIAVGSAQGQTENSTASDGVVPGQDAE